jgi:hypothetical protein
MADGGASADQQLRQEFLQGPVREALRAVVVVDPRLASPARWSTLVPAALLKNLPFRRTAGRMRRVRWCAVRFSPTQLHMRSHRVLGGQGPAAQCHLAPGGRSSFVAVLHHVGKETQRG